MGIEEYQSYTVAKPTIHEHMKDKQVGDTIYVTGTIEAFRTGFRKKEVRVNINGIQMWIDYEWLMNQ